MAAKKIIQDTKLTRGAAKKDPKPLMHIYSEGEVTEIQYIRDYYRISKKHVALGDLQGGLAPKTVADRCEEKKQEIKTTSRRDPMRRKDLVWGVFDVDGHDLLVESIRRIRSSGCDVAVSNPCIEVWGLLHYSKVDQPMSNTKAQSELAKKMLGYHHKNNAAFNFSQLSPEMIQAAKDNAKHGRISREREGSLFPANSPFSCFDHLLRAIDGEDIDVNDIKTYPVLR